MAQKQESKERIVKGNKVVCPICKGEKFWERRTLMNTPGMTFFGLDWANRAATNLVCGNCGYVHWFMNQ